MIDLLIIHPCLVSPLRLPYCFCTVHLFVVIYRTAYGRAVYPYFSLQLLVLRRLLVINDAVRRPTACCGVPPVCEVSPAVRLFCKGLGAIFCCNLGWAISLGGNLLLHCHGSQTLLFNSHRPEPQWPGLWLATQ